jgi:hypothetical protein
VRVDVMTRPRRLAVPAAVTAAFVVAVVAGPLLPRSGDLPGAALGTTWLLYGLRALLIFYGLLLLVIPLIRALRGELPVELSMSGARYAEASERTLGTLEARIGELEGAVRALGQGAAASDARLTALEHARSQQRNPRR